jgi:hypothetical protein
MTSGRAKWQVARNRGGMTVAIPGVEWKGLRDIELLKVLWGILLKAHFVMRYLLVRYVLRFFVVSGWTSLSFPA